MEPELSTENDGLIFKQAKREKQKANEAINKCENQFKEINKKINTTWNNQVDEKNKCEEFKNIINGLKKQIDTFSKDIENMDKCKEEDLNRISLLNEKLKSRLNEESKLKEKKVLLDRRNDKINDHISIIKGRQSIYEKNFGCLLTVLSPDKFKLSFISDVKVNGSITFKYLKDDYKFEVVEINPSNEITLRCKERFNKHKDTQLLLCEFRKSLLL